MTAPPSPVRARWRLTEVTRRNTHTLPLLSHAETLVQLIVRLDLLIVEVDHFLKTGSRLPVRWPWHIFDKSELELELAQANLEIVAKWAKLPLLSDSYYVLVQRA